MTGSASQRWTLRGHKNKETGEGFGERVVEDWAPSEAGGFLNSTFWHCFFHRVFHRVLEVPWGPLFGDFGAPGLQKGRYFGVILVTFWGCTGHVRIELSLESQLDPDG